MTSKDLFKGINAVILESGLGKARKKILAKKLEEKGGVSSDIMSPAVTHVLVGGTVKDTRIPVLLKVKEIDKHVQILRADWISKCLTETKLVSTKSYTVQETCDAVYDTVSLLVTGDKESTQSSIADNRQPNESPQFTPNTTPTKSPHHFTSPEKKSPHSKPSMADSDDSDYVESDEERPVSHDLTTGHDDNTDLPPAKKFKGRWVCEIPSSSMQAVNHNKHITDKLQELLQVYKNSTDAKDQWRVMGYTKAISALKNYPKPITSWEEANNLPSVGRRLADKIWEIVSSGHLRRLDHIDEKQIMIDMFGKIWGVGPTCAQRFVALGYRTLDELKTSGQLNRQQLIGLAHYDEFLERMPREEAGEIEEKVKEAAVALCPGAEAVACGSYRRGKKDCGDVDVLVTHPDGRSHKGLFSLLLQRLRNSGFITDDLTVQEDHGGLNKYLGVCRLPGEGRKHRRLDIIVVPYSEYPCALLYFTGSGHFNRSMRLKARKMGMALSEHSLRKDVIRKGQEKLLEGTMVPVFSEKDVFKHLDMPYLEPHDRNWD